jgi:glycerol-3-phosphate dehydrogenase (NAD(P)+)
MATCNSPLSRNYQVGYALAQGKTLAEILTVLQGTAEGLNTTSVLLQLAAQQSIELPIATQVANLIAQETTPQLAMQALMEREHKPE